MKKLTITIIFCAAPLFAQTAQIQLCDAQATSHCMTIKPPATLPADVTCTLGTSDLGSCAIVSGVVTTDTPQLITADKEFSGNIKLWNSYLMFAGASQTTVFSMLANDNGTLGIYDASDDQAIFLTGSAFTGDFQLYRDLWPGYDAQYLNGTPSHQWLALNTVDANLGGILTFNSGASTRFTVQGSNSGATNYLDWKDPYSVLAMRLGAGGSYFRDRYLYLQYGLDPSTNARIDAGASGADVQATTGTYGAGIGADAYGAYFMVLQAGSWTHGATGTGCSSFDGGICMVAATPMGYPGAGVANSTGSAWGISYTVGTAANNLVQLNGSAQLPAVSGALLTNVPSIGTIFTVFGNDWNVSANVTVYMGPYTPSGAEFIESWVQEAIPHTGTFQNLFVRTISAMPGNSTVVFTLRKNGSDTAVTVTIPASSAAGTFSDTAHTVSYSQGDLWDVKAVNSGGGVSATFAAVAIQFN